MFSVIVVNDLLLCIAFWGKSSFNTIIVIHSAREEGVDELHLSFLFTFFSRKKAVLVTALTWLKKVSLEYNTSRLWIKKENKYIMASKLLIILETHQSISVSDKSLVYGEKNASVIYF